jgi:hypothetical protein
MVSLDYKPPEVKTYWDLDYPDKVSITQCNLLNILTDVGIENPRPQDRRGDSAQTQRAFARVG